MRLISWLLGCALLTYCTSGPLGVYGHILFSAHMAEHLLLVLVTPILLIGGAPTTLALRALPANRRDHGPREWLLAALSSKFLKVASHPIIAFVNFAAGFFILYFSGLFEWLMRSHLGHSFMQGHFLITGYMFIWCITGIDPSPRVLPAPAKVGLAVLAAPFHAIFSVIIMQSTSVIAVDYYAQFTHLYNTNLLHDQYLGASLGWAFGEVPLLVMIIIAVIQWVRSDAREAARFDRRDDERRAREAADGTANEASQTP
jgi:putative copper resistance protein D